MFSYGRGTPVRFRGSGFGVIVSCVGFRVSGLRVSSSGSKVLIVGWRFKGKKVEGARFTVSVLDFEP